MRQCSSAGVFGIHESLLFNGFAVTLALETLRKGRAVRASEIDLATVRQQAVYPGLDLIDMLQTEALIPVLEPRNTIHQVVVGRMVSRSDWGP